MFSDSSSPPTWVQEMAPTGGPRPRLSLLILVMIAAVIFSLFAPSIWAAEQASPTPYKPPPKCAQHWPTTCDQEAQRGR